jgi:hypothetical protein
LLFGRSQDALEADHKEIADQVGVNGDPTVLYPPLVRSRALPALQSGIPELGPRYFVWPLLIKLR